MSDSHLHLPEWLMIMASGTQKKQPGVEKKKEYHYPDIRPRSSEANYIQPGQWREGGRERALLARSHKPWWVWQYKAGNIIYSGLLISGTFLNQQDSDTILPPNMRPEKLISSPRQRWPRPPPLCPYCELLCHKLTFSHRCFQSIFLLVTLPTSPSGYANQTCCQWTMSLQPYCWMPQQRNLSSSVRRHNPLQTPHPRDPATPWASTAATHSSLL